MSGDDKLIRFLRAHLKYAKELAGILAGDPYDVVLRSQMQIAEATIRAMGSARQSNAATTEALKSAAGDLRAAIEVMERRLSRRDADRDHQLRRLLAACLVMCAASSCMAGAVAIKTFWPANAFAGAADPRDGAATASPTIEQGSDR